MHFHDIEVELTDSWINISHLYIICDLVDNKVVVIDSLFNYIDVVDQSNIKNIDGKTYTNIRNRYSDIYSNDGMRDVYKHYNAQFEESNAKQNVICFSICPTLSCNLACSYCFEKDYQKVCSVMTMERLQLIESHVSKEIDEIRVNHPGSYINLELFGGEPIQQKNRELILEFLKFARSKKCGVSIISNGYELKDFVLDMVQYRDVIGQICVTLDGTKEYHDKLRITKKNGGSFDRIVDAVDLYLKLGINVSIATNLCSENIESIADLFSYYRSKGWLDSEFFNVYIGRVFSRTTANVPENILYEGMILQKIYELFPDACPKWLHLSFIKSSAQLAKEIGMLYNQNEYGKADYHYCWSTSPILMGYYVDSELNTYRCTTTVGNTKYSIGKLDDTTKYDTYLQNSLFSRNVFSDPQCIRCEIGGFCGGGCVLEREYRKNVACDYEKKSFSDFIERIFKPKFKFLYEKAMEQK